MPTIHSINPFTQEVLKEYELLTDAQIIAKIERAQSAFLEWKQTSSGEKKRLFLRLAQVIEDNIESIAQLQTLEMGMLLTDSIGGLKKTCDLIRWFANNFETILAPEEFDTEGTKGRYMYDPIGVIFGVAPWNFPYNQVLRAAVPNIIAWNVQLYKHASNVPMCAHKLEELFHEAGFPSGIYTNVFMSASQSEVAIAHPFVKWVNLTGSEGAGKSIGALAGKYLKPSVLELGGNDAFIVLDVANIEALAKSAAGARCGNGGQRCNSSKRFIVLEKDYDRFVTAFAQEMGKLVLWDPMLSSTQLQPLARRDLVDEVEKQVQQTIAQGARCVIWGKRVPWDANFFEATVLADVTPTMTSYNEEIFWPVASVIRSKSIEESIAIANDSDFGLCGSVWGDDVEQCKTVAAQIHTGMVCINAPAWSRAHLPFGGVKKSGYGKENGAEGLKSFTNKKVIVY